MFYNKSLNYQALLQIHNLRKPSSGGFELNPFTRILRLRAVLASEVPKKQFESLFVSFPLVTKYRVYLFYLNPFLKQKTIPIFRLYWFFLGGAV